MGLVLQAQRLRRVDVADGDGQGVCRIGRLGQFGQIEKASHHELNLLLFCETVADHAGLDFKRCVLSHGQTLAGRGKQRHSPHLTQLERRLGIHRIKNLFNGDNVRLPTLDFSGEFTKHLFKTLGGGFCLAQPDSPHGFAEQALFARGLVRLHDAVAGDLGSTIDSKHPHRVQVYRRWRYLMANERLQCAGLYKPVFGPIFQQANSATRNWTVHESLIKNHTKVSFKKPKPLSNRIKHESVMERLSPKSIKHDAAVWLRQGMSPQRLAVTLALGFAIGCIPVVGIPTVLCAGLALALRLNLPAIQVANYLAMPLQLVLIVPFVRMGGWLLASGSAKTPSTREILKYSPFELVTQMTSLAGHALLAWVLMAIPAVLLMTVTLTVMLRRIPALAPVEVGD